MRYFINALLLVSASCLLHGCGNKQGQVFELRDAASTGITFSNDLIYTDTLTVLDFEYLYNGGGVGIGDINNDGLQDVYFTGNMTSGKLYLNKGNLKFEDITQSAGVGTQVWLNGVSVVDINQDGFMDIFLCVAGTRNTPARKKKNLLFINNGNSTFTESAMAYGLQGTDHNIQSTFFDYDRDGDLDVYILRNAFVDYSRNMARNKSINGESSTTHQLYKNNGNNTFTNVSAQAGILIEGFGLGVQVCDINDDQWPDILASNDFITNDLLYINNQDGTFTNQAGKYFKHETYNAMGNDVADINNDGLPDIIEVDMLPEDNLRWKVTIMGNNYDEFENSLRFGYEPQYIRNTLQLNNGNGTFSEIGYLAGIEATDWSWSPLLADYDNDGQKDLFVTNGYRQDITNLDFIKFSERTSHMGTVEGNKKERLEMLKTIPGIKLHNYVYRNNGDLTFSDMSKDWGMSEPSFSNGSAYSDLDNDGDLDLITNNIDSPASVYENKSAGLPEASNFLKIQFEGPHANRNGLGTRVYLYHKGTIQHQYFTTTRGFLSSVEPNLHFGLDSLKVIDSIRVIWPDGKYELLKNIEANQRLTVQYAKSVGGTDKIYTTAPTLFSDVTEQMGIIYRHKENDHVDFKVQPLLPHMHSKNGPGIAVADVNGDGLDDVYIGGAMGQQGNLFTQDGTGKFRQSFLTSLDSAADKMGILFFDADNDHDDDLYIVTGGSEHPKDSPFYEDHLYLNDGKGNFALAAGALPAIYQSGSCVTATDFDHDGDLDLFVGGRIIPGSYPLPAPSYILQNDSGDGVCRFTDITANVAPTLLKLGLVTSALWTDVDNDKWMDLMIVGELMPIICFKNNGGKSFSPFATESFAHSSGWWNSITSGDFDNDGDMDYIAGNLGLNSRYRGNTKEPLCIYAADFDKTGSIDPVMSMYFDGKKQVAHSWDDMVKQMVPIRARFRTYLPYAEADFEKSFSRSEIEAAYVVCGEWFQSSYIENVGGGKFSISALPMRTQFSPVFGAISGDYNDDGNLDILLSGNSYATEVSTGRYDASIGVHLQGDGKGHFKNVDVRTSGFMVDKDAKGLASILQQDGREMIVSSTNNNQVKVFSRNIKQRTYKVLADETYAIIKLKDGRQYREEFYYGSTYLSQSSRFVKLPRDISSCDVYNFKGEKKDIAVHKE